MPDKHPHRAAIERLEKARDTLDRRAPAILAFHAVIEREIELALADLLPNAELLRNLGFGQKISVWAATQAAEAADLEKLLAPMLRLNDLRNAVAHGDSSKEISDALKRLALSLPEYDGKADEQALGFAAGYISGVLNSRHPNEVEDD